VVRPERIPQMNRPFIAPRHLLAAALLVLSIAPQAHAAASSAFADTTKPVTFLKETVVTGARYPRAYYESPQALSFLSRSQLRELSPMVIGDALQTLPGVDNSKDSPWEQRVVLRGLSGQRVLVLVDGIPMNSARGNGPHPSLVATPMIDRVEVVRGPSSVSYGSDAIGGALNIITRDVAPAGDGRSSGMNGSAQIGGGSADHVFGGQAEVRPYVGKLGMQIAGGWNKANDFETPDATVANSAYKDWNGAVNARYDFSSRLTLRTGYQAYRGTDIGIPGLSFDIPNAAKQDFSFRYYDRDLAHVTLDHHYPNGWVENTRLRAYWQNERRNFFSNENIQAAAFPTFGVFGAPLGAVSRVTEQDRFFDLKTIGGQLQLTSKRHEGYRWTAGLDAATDRTSGNNIRRRAYHFNGVGGVDSTGVVTLRTTQSVPNGSFDSYGAYFQNEWYLTPEWTLATGVRGTRYKYHAKAGPLAPGFNFTDRVTRNDALCGSLGLVWSPKTNLHVSANVSNGYRQPNAQDLYFDGAASVGFVVGNPNLSPEKAVSYDLGMRWGPGNTAISANVFLTQFKDLIDALRVASVPEAQGQPTYQYANIAKARTYGVEVEAEATVQRDFVLRGTVASTVGEITSADAIRQLYGVPGQDRAPLGGVPPCKGSMSVRWNEPTSHYFVELGSRWSWRTNRLPLPTPGVGQLTDFKKEWITADISGGVKLPSGQRVVVGVRNLANTVYRQALGSLDEPGRSFYGTLSTNF
jgi:hemoglobin/transferrin/lactoferrin receptor protein